MPGGRADVSAPIQLDELLVRHWHVDVRSGGRALIDQVDRAALEQVARVTETNGALKISLGDG